MGTNYKITDLKKALEDIQSNDQSCERISMDDFEKVVKRYSQAWIYNIDEMINLLEAYIESATRNFFGNLNNVPEGEVCEILKVRKLAMNKWRKKNYIRIEPTHNRSIRYDLFKLLDDLKNVRDKNISVKCKTMK